MIPAHWQERIRAAAADRRALCIRGGGSKDFYGETPRGERFDTREYAGIETYEPTELVLTARCGTPLAEIESALAERGQMLAFEPPHFGCDGAAGASTMDGAAGASTIGGVVAAGLSGPRRLAAGAVRDFVLGVRLLDGQGRLLRFGGEVMKNVAGYDVSRMLVGSLGALGILAEVSLKVMPRPAREATLALELPQAAAIEQINRWGGRPLPISASAWLADRLYVRLSGAPTAVRAAAAALGGELLGESDADEFWRSIRDQTHGFFEGGAIDGGGQPRAAAPGRAPDLRLWRVSVPTATPPLDIAGAHCLEWGGGQRWLLTSAEARHVRTVVAAAGGHATLFRRPLPAAGDDGAIEEEVFTRPAPPLMAIHQRLKHAFDPAGILNPGRLYAEL